MGLNANRTKLFLFTVDGRQTGYSEGMTTIEIAQLLQNDYAVTDAINLDGGGSTTLVMADPTVHIVNSPSDGVERLQGCNFGVFATVPQVPSFVAGSAQQIGNNFQIAVSGTSGALYEIYASTNLQTWNFLQTLTMTNTTTTLICSNIPSTSCFYRARLAP
jgi:hypothetical protein